MKLLAFDLEVAAIVPDGETLFDKRPLGITCAATARYMAWSDTYIYDKFNGGRKINQYLPRMSLDECVEMVYFLQTAVRHGYTILTHNGCSFDFSVLAEESGMHRECVELAMNSVDTCLLVHCLKGYPVGLDAIAKGFGLAGKTEGMNGALAPQMWADGEYTKVLEYCAQDTRTTLEVALAIEKHQAITWIAKSGRLNSVPIERLLTVQECLSLPAPDTSWMSGERMTREKFTAWMTAKQPE